MITPAGYLINTPEGLRGEPGIAYDYIMASSGLYLRAKNERLRATICISEVEVRGLKDIEESIELVHGKIPAALLDLAVSILLVRPDIERYVAITWNDGYSLKIPPQSRTEASVKYDVLPGTIMDIHSHAGEMTSFFSSTDNKDEQGFCIYAVIGDLNEPEPTIEMRLGVYGYFIPLKKEEVFI